MANPATVNPPPAANPVVDAGQRVTLPWLQFFQQQYQSVLVNGGFLYTGTAHQVLHGNAVLPTWSAVDLVLDTTGTLAISHGGTNSATALSGNSIMISDGTSVVQGAKGTTTTVLHGNAAGSPTYGAVVLTADVSGILPVANGGTGLATETYKHDFLLMGA